MSVRTAGRLGYCFGVSEAIAKAIKYAEQHGKVYSLGTLAHNEDVVEYVRQHGVEPIKIEDLQLGSHVAITAHGAPPETYRRLEESGCKILDCTCPIVQKAQKVVSQQLDGFDILIFGNPNHQEVIGLNGWAGGAKFVGGFDSLFTLGQEFKNLELGRRVGVISQTTKIPADYTEFVSTLVYHNLYRISELRVFNTICPIVAARIGQTRKLAAEVDVMFVVGSQESANTQNLVRVASSVMGIKPVFLVLRDGDFVTAFTESRLARDWKDINIGMTAGTSTPIEVVDAVVKRLKELLHET